MGDKKFTKYESLRSSVGDKIELELIKDSSDDEAGVVEDRNDMKAGMTQHKYDI